MDKLSRHRVPIAAFMLCLAVCFASGSASAQRLRLGVEGGFGGEWGTPKGPSSGLFGQLGLQLGDTFALFYQPSLFVHALGTSDNADVFAAWGNLAMADVTLGILQLGVGGGFDLGRFATCAGNTCSSSGLEAHPALGGRVALVLSLPLPRSRIGIPFALQIHSTFLDNGQRLTALLLTIGIQRF